MSIGVAVFSLLDRRAPGAPRPYTLFPYTAFCRSGHDTDWLLPAGHRLFDTALARAWDNAYGGICYGFAPDGSVCDDDKYFWVQAESLVAAALLHARTGAAAYDDWYGKLWTYAWQHFVDHRHGAWYRILNRSEEHTSELQSLMRISHAAFCLKKKKINI